jgi:surface protein
LINAVLNHSGFDLSGITNLSSVLKNANVTQTILDAIPFENATNLNAAFSYAVIDPSLSTLEIDVSHATNVTEMFESANLTNKFSLRLKNMPTTLTSLEEMFASSYGPTTFSRFDLDLSGIDVSHVTSMRRMFNYSYAKSIDFDGWDTSAVTNMNSFFSNMPSISGGETIKLWMPSTFVYTGTSSNNPFTSGYSNAKFEIYTDVLEENVSQQGWWSTKPSSVTTVHYGATHADFLAAIA